MMALLLIKAIAVERLKVLEKVKLR